MKQSPESVWNHCLDIIQDNVNRQSYKTWFEPLQAVRLEEEGGSKKLTVELPSRFYYEWLEEHYVGLLRKTVAKVLGDEGRLVYDVVMERDNEDQGREGATVQLPSKRSSEQTQEKARPGTPRKKQQRRPSWQEGAPGGRSHQQVPGRQKSRPAIQNPFAVPGMPRGDVESQLNDSYTFDRFIEGDCNRLARSASWAIAQNPGTTNFNPFLIYGGVGLGKTHLIQAVGNHVLEQRKADSVLYVSSEKFTNDFVQAIQHNRINDFSMFYRQIDLLIVDDVQFFSGKEKTQEEFFHVFNALHQSGKQIVLSADRAPREIKGIEERLLSRFQWGLSADVQAPEFETRIAILQRKAEDDGIELSHDVIEFIAHNIKSNIRELEGALIRLLAHSTLHQRELDLALAKEILSDLVQDQHLNLTIEEIQRVVCEYLDIEEDKVRARTRKREVVRARQIAMYFSKEMTQHSLKTIGLHFGGRDHSTVIHANKTVEDHMDTDPNFRETVSDIRKKIELRSR